MPGIIYVLIRSIVAFFMAFISVVLLIGFLIKRCTKKKPAPQPLVYARASDRCPRGTMPLGHCSICHMHDHCFPDSPIHKFTLFDHQALWLPSTHTEEQAEEQLPDLMRFDSPNDLFDEPDYHDSRYDDLMDYEEEPEQ